MRERERAREIFNVHCCGINLINLIHTQRVSGLKNHQGSWLFIIVENIEDKQRRDA